MTTFAIGLDLGGTNARAALVDSTGRILATHKVQHAGAGPEHIADLLADCVREAEEKAGVSHADCAGAGMGFAGQIDAATRRVLVAPNLGWRDVDFAGPLSARLGTNVRFANDLAVAALGESRVGAAKGLANAVLVFMGSGVGCGLVLNGQVYSGSHGVAGEFGHVKVRPGGRPCGCGERGCLEAYAGGHALGARVLEAIAAGRATSIAVPPGLRPSVSLIDEAANAGDALSLELREEAAQLVGVAAANVMTLLNPAVLVLGGGVLRGSPYIRRRVEEVVREEASRASLRQLFIVDATLGDDAGVIGGAFLALA